MEPEYVVLYVRQNGKYREFNAKLIKILKSQNIRHITIDLSEKHNLYGNEVPFEGAFALEFSGLGTVKTPTLPLAVAGEKIFSGLAEIEDNLEYLRKNYSSPPK